MKTLTEFTYKFSKDSTPIGHADPGETVKFIVEDCFEGQVTAWAFVSPDRRKILLCAYRVLCVPNTAPARIRLRGLDPGAVYETEDGRRFTGAALMYQGITLPLRGDFSSEVMVLKSV